MVTLPYQLHLGIREGRHLAHVRPRVGGNSDGNGDVTGRCAAAAPIPPSTFVVIHDVRHQRRAGMCGGAHNDDVASDVRALMHNAVLQPAADCRVSWCCHDADATRVVPASVAPCYNFHQTVQVAHSDPSPRSVEVSDRAYLMLSLHHCTDPNALEPLAHPAATSSRRPGSDMDNSGSGGIALADADTNDTVRALVAASVLLGYAVVPLQNLLQGRLPSFDGWVHVHSCEADAIRGDQFTALGQLRVTCKMAS
jgi:hypothetical protein